MAVRTVGNLRTRLSFEDGGTIRSLEKFKQDLRGLRSEMITVTSQGGKYANSLKGLKQQQDILNRELRVHQERLKEIKKRYDEAVEAKGADSDEAKKLARDYNYATAQLNRTEEQLRKVTQAIKDQQNPWKNLSRDLDAASKKFEDFGDRATEFGRSYTTKVTAPIIAGGTAVFKAAMDYESAFAGVRKTVDATEEELAKLSKGIREMAKELPASATEIAGVAEAAGQLGIETENILKFTRTMIDLSEATNLTAEQAATQFARFANIVGMSQKDFDRLGSTVVALGNNFATTEAEIVEMAMRLAGAGAQIGLTEAQIMSFATALSSVGIAAEMGGSAFSKVMVQMQLAVEQGGKDLIYFAKVAGMSAEDFRKAFEQDAARAITAFLKGLSTAEERGMSAIAILDEMGIKEVRLRDTLLRAAGAYDVFNNAVELGNKAWKENTALTEEAEQRYQTTESRLKILWNRIKDVAITVGDALAPAIMDALDAAEPFIKSIEDGAKAFSELDKEQQRAILKFIGLVAAIGPASVAVGTLSKGIGGLLSVGSSLAGLLGDAAGGTGLLAKIASLGTGGVAGIAIAGIGLLTAGIISFTNSMEKSVEATFDELEARQKQIEETDKLIERYEELKLKNRLSNDEMLRFLDIQSELEQTASPDKIKELTEEQEKLLEKSGLTNEEMEEFIGLNGKILEEAPNTSRAISEQGKAWAENTDAIRELNEQKLQTLKIDAEIAMQNVIEKENKLLQKQKELIENIQKTEEERKQTYDNIIQLGEEIAQKEEEIRKLKEEINTINRDDLVQHQAKIRSAEEELFALRDQLETEKMKLETILKQLEKHSENLELTNEELRKLDETKWRYEELVLAMVGLNSERGKGLEMIQLEIAKLMEEKKKLKELHETGKLPTQEYQEQLRVLDKQIGKLENAQDELKRINELAGKEIYKDIKISNAPKEYAEQLNRILGKTIRKQVVIEHSPTGPYMARYEKGTNYHPGGLAIAGEKGPELAKLGNKWAMLDFGIWNLPRGTQVIPHDESMKILNAIKRIPAYAEGIYNSGQLSQIMNRLNQPEPVRETKIVIENMTVRNDTDIKLIARELYNLQKAERRGRGYVNIHFA